jgi:hypothetical protein
MDKHEDNLKLIIFGVSLKGGVDNLAESINGAPLLLLFSAFGSHPM